MPVTPSKAPSPFEPTPLRRFFTRAEAATLIGMVTIITSLFLTWEHKDPGIAPALQAGAIHIESLSIVRDGFGARAALPLTVCAIVCASTLLWNVTPQNRLALGAVQGAGGLACVVIALTRFALLPGVLVALAGGALLLLGAIDRYMQAVPAAKT